MDPNTAIVEILNQIQLIGAMSDESNKHDSLVETIVKLHDLGKWMESGGSGPDLLFTYEVL